MITFPRAAVRIFRAVVRKGVAGRGREPAPPIVLLPDAEVVTFQVHLPSIVIAYRVPTDQAGSAPMVVPMAAFDAVSGPGNDSITIEPKSKLGAELRWNDRGQPRTQSVGIERLSAAHERPAEPKAFVPMPPEFLAALHEAGRTAGDTKSRYALDRIQLKGRTGEVIASDGQQAYLHGGFRFPFKEDLLLPALPIFGSPELRKETEIGLGRTATHLIVRIGPWTLYLVLDAVGRYPDVAAVVPKATSATVLELDEADVADLLAALPRLPGSKHERRPVTLDLVAGQHAIVRAGSRGEKMAEVTLDRSTVTKGSVRVAVDRTFLDRAIRLGCRTVHAVSAETPVVARGGNIILLAGALDPDLIVLPHAQAEKESSRALVLAPPPTVERNPPLDIAPVNAVPEAIAVVEPPNAIDPFAEAEALRIVFVEAGQRLGRLVEWFKIRRKEPKALARVWSTLQSLKLRP